MQGRHWFALVTALLVAGFMFGVFANDRDSGEVLRPKRTALVVALLFPLALVPLSFLRGFDGFAFGSVVLAVLIEAVLFLGWLASPQEESGTHFFVASGLPLTLIVVTWLFNYLQKEA